MFYQRSLKCCDKKLMESKSERVKIFKDVSWYTNKLKLSLYLRALQTMLGPAT